MVRTPVFERLDGATGCVAVVSAPGGYGKTSQVALWAQQDGRYVSWVQLSVGDDRPSTLLSLLDRALSSVTRLDADASWDEATSSQRYWTIVASALGRAVRHATSPFVLVLDDFHVLIDEASTDLVAAIAENVPSGSTLVLVTRSRPGRALARARVHPGVVEVGTAELALDRGDVAAVFRSIGVAEDDRLIERSIDETEGWPAGVRLVGFELLTAGVEPQDREWPSAGPNRSVVDYVDSEWLHGLSPVERDFLMRVSGLDWLSGRLCDHVLDRADSGQILARLHANRLTVLPLDRHGSAYRMHRILREVLLAEFDRVDREQRHSVDLSASEWFETVGDIDRAVRHAVRGGDVDRAIRLIDLHAVAHQTRGRHEHVAEWIGLLPRLLVTTRSDLCLASAVSALGMGLGDEALVWTRMALASDTGGALQGRNHVDLRAAALNALLGTGTIAQLMREVREAYTELPHGHWRAVACEGYGALAFAVGKVELACQLFAEGAAEAAVVGARTDEAHCRAHLAIALDELGEVERSHEAALAARQIVRDNDLTGVPTLVVVSAVSALTAARDGDRALAESEFCVTAGRLGHFASIAGLLNIQVRIALARTAVHLGDPVGAQTLLDETRSLLVSWVDAVMPFRQVDDVAHQILTSQLPASSPLTEAELRVLRFLPTNLRHQEIADRLFVSRNTVKTHTASIYRKLGVTTRSAAVDRARRAGLLSVEVVPSRR